MKTIVIGARGGIGSAFVAALTTQGRPPIALARPEIDLLDETSIATAAQRCGDDIDLVIDATGFLHGEGMGPERSWKQLDPTHLARNFAINAIGPALLMKHFLPRLARDRRAVFVTLSARVGSISDNNLGGWYAYRAAKAALNQIVRTASIELRRQSKLSICVALHPGTVATGLSAPFSKSGLDVQEPAVAVGRMLAVIDALAPEQSGLLIDHHGVVIPY